MTSETFMEPGFLILAGLVGVAAISCVSSIFMKRAVVRMVSKIEAVRNDPDYSSDDETWITAFLADAKSNTIVLMALASPLLIIMGPLAAISEAAGFRKGEQPPRPLPGRANDLDAKLLKLQYNVDIKVTPLWKSAAKTEISDTAETIQFLRHPFASIWMTMVLLPAVLTFLVCAGVVHMSFTNIRAFVRKLLNTYSSGVLSTKAATDFGSH